MINLIPPEAKKHLIREYWIRSVTVWFFLWAAVFLLGIAVLVPSYVLINLQVKAYSASAASADEKNAGFEAVSKELERASKMAATLSNHFENPSMTELITLLKGFELSSIEITQMSLAREGANIGAVTVAGIADDRQSLATFRNRMLDSEQIESVDLPISNLAKDKQIPFELTITMAKPKAP